MTQLRGSRDLVPMSLEEEGRDQINEQDVNVSQPPNPVHYYTEMEGAAPVKLKKQLHTQRQTTANASPILKSDRHP